VLPAACSLRPLPAASAAYAHYLPRLTAPRCALPAARCPLPAARCLQRLAPVYEKVAEHFHADRASAVRIAKMDATAETEIAERYNVVGFPSIVLLQGGTSHDFKGQRTFEEIVRFVESHAPKKAPTPAGGALTATAQLTAAGERLIAVMHQLRDYVREVFTTLTVAEVAWSYWRFGASLSGLIFIAIASIQTLDQRRED